MLGFVGIGVGHKSDYTKMWPGKLNQDGESKNQGCSPTSHTLMCIRQTKNQTEHSVSGRCPPAIAHQSSLQGPYSNM